MRIYVAGKYNDSNVIDILENIRFGTRICTMLLIAGHTPFCPWLDYQFYFQLRESESLTVDDFKRYSMDWLEVSEALLVLPGWEKSNGTKAEMARAEELGIPIYFDMSELEGQ